jgi:hypothetical protein
MPSVFQRLLGVDFDRLHPRLQEQYRITSADHMAFRSRGVMEEIQRGRFYTVPFLRLGSRRGVMFHECGRDVPFTIENYSYLDSFGRETMTWTRVFEFPKRARRFDETMIFSDRRGCAVVYAGSHQHLAVELSASVDEGGALLIRTGAQRLYEWRFGIRFPLLFSGRAKAREWFDDDTGCYRIDLEIANAVWGRIFAYRGWFRGEVGPCPADSIPHAAKPVREESRE